MTFVADPLKPPQQRRHLAGRPQPRLPLVVGARGARADADRLGVRVGRVGRRGQRVPRLLEPARERQHRSSAPQGLAAIREQAELLTTVAPAHANATRARAAEMICELAPEGFEKVFFTNGGADANENAIRMARLVTGRDKVISRYRSYHGNTGAAIVATGRLAPHPQRVRARPRARVRPLPLPLGVLGDHRRGGVRPRAAPPRARHPGRGCLDDRGDPARDRARHGGHHDAAEGLPRRRARDLRPVRHRHDPRRGHGRLRPHGGVVRIPHAHASRPTSSPSPKGVNSGYVPVGGVIISDAIAHHFDDTVFPGA